MKEAMDRPYIPGTGPIPELPLGRFIPPVPAGMASSWCKEFLSPGDWVLEPFGYNPVVLIEIASSGFPVLTTVNNPIHAFMLETIASAPQEEDFTAALQDLAIESKGDERMEPYIRSLYMVTCADCKRQIEADSFLWEKGSDYPFAAQVKCPYCGAEGDQEITGDDIENLNALPPLKLHKARALNRIVGPEDPTRSQVINALNAYPPRPLIVLQTIINKLDSLEQTPKNRALLIALILSAADKGNTLWAYPSPRSRPRQIVVPNIYQERNLWKVMEESAKIWQLIQKPIPIKSWGDSPIEPQGIFLYPGRIRELTPQPEKSFFSAVLAAVPRPNQAFWTFSALWTGWIWGQEAVTPIRKVLSRQRYDWNWHTNALRGVFEAIKPYNHPQLIVGSLIAENEPMLILANLLAAETAGLTLSAYAQSLDDQLSQCFWRINNYPIEAVKPDAAIAIANKKVREYLQKKGEPANYQQVHAAAITGLANENNLAVDIFLENPNSAASETQKWVETLFNETNLLIKVGEDTASIETGDWWLNEVGKVSTPLIDRVEETLLNHLLDHKETSAHEIKKVIYQNFQGILTPEDKVILSCLESYADLIDPQARTWRLRDNEEKEARIKEVKFIREIIKKIGARLTYKVAGEDPVLWFDESQKTATYSFHIFSTAIVPNHIKGNNSIAKIKVLVLPGSRANLLAYKKQRDPVLSEKLDREFITVKFRLIRDLEANPLLSRELLIEQFHVDPPEYQSSQLALF